MAADIADDVSGGRGRALITVIVGNVDLSTSNSEGNLAAYIDDSKAPDGTLAISAGYLFEPSSARQFRKQWKPFLDSKEMKYFHAKDDMRRPDEDAIEIFTALAKLIKQTALRGFVNLITPESVTSLDKSIRPYLGSVFSAATLGCMHMIAGHAKELKRPVVYFIEDQNEFGGELRDFLNQIKARPHLKADYAMAGADTYDKKAVIQLQAADLFAWSFSRSHYREKWAPPIVELVQDGAVRHTMSSFSPVFLSLANSANGLYSNRKHFDSGKRTKRNKKAGNGDNE